MKRKLPAVLGILMVLALGIMAAGCNSKPSLEEWYTENKAMFDEEAAIEAKGYTCEIMVTDSNVLLYQHNLSEVYPTDDENLAALTTLYDSKFSSYENHYSELLAQMNEETGTKDIVIRLAVVNPDGAVLYSKDYTGAE